MYVSFSGISNYDSHFLIQKLHQYIESNIHIILHTGEKYLSLQMGNLPFKDSYQVLSESLANLIWALKENGEHYSHYVNKYIPDINDWCFLLFLCE